jgi:hypothetical protein
MIRDSGQGSGSYRKLMRNPTTISSLKAGKLELCGVAHHLDGQSQLRLVVRDQAKANKLPPEVVFMIIPTIATLACPKTSTTDVPSFHRIF